MSVHYKFKSTLNFDTITFDGLHISVGDLKREIVHQKHLGKIGDFDLQISNAQTKEEYQDDAYLIPKNTTLIISRIPVAHHSKKGWETQQLDDILVTQATKHETSNVDLFKMQGSEEDKIQAMMLQSTADYDPKTYHRIKGQSQIGEVPVTYRCNKCKKGGHWIKNCPYNIGKEHQDIKRNTGIPRSFRDKPELSQQCESKEPIMVQQKVPDDLLCSICHDIFLDAVMIPCCGSSFCDDCVRTALLESEDNECPDCKEKGCSPGSLIPNRFLRNSVNAFKNETGYKTSFKNCVQQNDISNTPGKANSKDGENKLTSLLDRKNSNPLSTEESANTNPILPREEGVSLDEEKTNLNLNENKVGNMPEQTTSKPVSNDSQASKGRDITLNLNPPGIENSIQVSPSRGPTERRQSPSLEFHSQNKPSKTSVIQSSTKEKKPMDTIQVENEQSIQLLQSGGQPNYHHIHVSGADRNNKLLENIDCSKRGQKINVFKPPIYSQLPIPPRMPEMHMQHCMPDSFNNGYNDIIPRQPIDYGIYPSHPPHPHHHYQMNNVRPAYPQSTHLSMNPPPIFANSNLASIYQGVAAKVGTGVIDDPLEAFNRIMKEKEKQKDERRRSPERRRSRTPDRLQKNRFRSPPYDRGSGRDILNRDKRPRSRETERRREHVYDRKNRYIGKGSTSPSEKWLRSLNHRSPSPKVGYPYSASDKPIKANDVNMETIEPPPPGFESIQNVQRDSEMREYVKYAKTSSKLTIKNAPRKSSIQSGADSKRKNKGLEKRERSDLSRSLTPPSKPKVKKLGENMVDMEKNSLKSEPKKSADMISKEVLLAEEKESVENELKDASFDKIDTQMKSDSSCTDPYVNRKSENKDARKSRDHKKKKKCRTERKKTKKDKKDKRDKCRKSSSPTNQPSQETDTTFSRQKHLDLNTHSEKQNSSDCKVGHLEASLHTKQSTIRNGTPRDSDHSRNSNQSKVIKNTTSPEFKRLDSVLDIEGYDTDFDDLGNHAKKLKTLDLQVSKWERDDQNVNSIEKESFFNDSDDCLQGKQNLITTDVIRKAENAIFARAINAIRPVEFKITIPTTSLSQERAVLIKSDVEKRSLSPKATKSVKDRLGSKVVQQKEHSKQQSRERESRESRDKRRSSIDNKEFNERRNPRRDREKYDRSESTQNTRNNFKQSNYKYDGKDRNSRKAGLGDSDLEHNAQKEKNICNYSENRSRNRNTSDRQNSSRDRNDKHKDFQKNKNFDLKPKECRTIVSVASKPSRIDNPFRKFEKNGSNHLSSKIKSSTKYKSSSSLDSQFNSDDKQKKRRKDKKIKKRSKFSSMESLNCENDKQMKNKKKIKSVKKKKKSNK